MTAQSLSFVVVGYFYLLLAIAHFAAIKSTCLGYLLATLLAFSVGESKPRTGLK
ncbi:hypothetical protein [Shewanella morhuae]|uniref:hypothetical protein n=1 Tax=Shewanella morhuae TaxID=365591 RepID=UPI0013565C3D|nr:hypothetical protein [Shewanella morhuae]